MTYQDAKHRAYSTLHFAARAAGIVFVEPTVALLAEHVVSIHIEGDDIMFSDINGCSYPYRPPTMAQKPASAATVGEYYTEAVQFWMQALEASRRPKV